MHRVTPIRMLALVVLAIPLLAPDPPQCVPIPVEPECLDDSVCDSGEACMIGYCDADTMQCVHVPAPDGTACDDRDACTVADACFDGNCYGTPMAYDDGNPCTELICDEATGDYYVPIDGPCDDGNRCTADDHCDEGICVPGFEIRGRAE